jgi:DNA-binding NtrC family response regulator
MSNAVQDALVRHSWPGNVRELENAIERAANYAWDGEIGIEHLPAHILHKEKENDGENLPSYRSVLNDVDKDIILDALRKTDGNKSAAARLLKISRSAFYEKLAKHGLQ